MDVKTPFLKTRRGLVILGFIVVSLIGVPLSVYFLQQQQIFQPQAWHTTQSATAACGPDGKVIVTVKFSNTESTGEANAMNVVASALPPLSGTNDLGKINPGETKSGTISTNLTSVAAGAVKFSLAWSNGRSGTDTRTATYPAVVVCTEPTATPTLTPTATLPPEEPTPTLTPTDVLTGTLTPTSEVTPTNGPTATPTTPSQNTSTPVPPTSTIAVYPTIAPSGPGDMFIGLGMVGVVLTVIGGLIFILL